MSFDSVVVGLAALSVLLSAAAVLISAPRLREGRLQGAQGLFFIGLAGIVVGTYILLTGGG